MSGVALDLLDLLRRQELRYMGAALVEYLGYKYTRWHLDQIGRHDLSRKQIGSLVSAITFSLDIAYIINDMEDKFPNFPQNFLLVARTEITE